MTTETTENNKPTHYVTRKYGVGDKATFETLGVAWDRENGLYVKLYGKQIVDGGFYVLENRQPVMEPQI